LVDYVKHSWFCLLIAFVAAGAIQEFIPRERMIAILGSGRGILPYFLAAAGAPVLSMCSCSIIPLFAGIYRLGAGLGPALAFLLAGPAINPAAVLLTAGLISWKLAVARAIFAVGIGMLTGFLVAKIYERGRPQDAPAAVVATVDEESRPFSKRLISSLVYSWEFVQLVLPLILLGVVMAGVLKALVPARLITEYMGNTFAATTAAAAMGVVAYTPTLVEVPFVKGLMELGLGTGPALAFLITGPALSLPSILGTMRVVGVKIPLTYAVVMWLLGTAAGLIFAALVPGVGL
ncbi:MAG: permease, partial [Armatimonadetes bacterium]|nr:permease [Armatimonadota bacterium]